MKQATIQYPDGLPRALKLSDREFSEELGFLAAAKLYELGRVTAGQAADLAGLPRLVFLERLEQIGVPAINLRNEEIEAEIRAALELAS
ncbi:MAG: UPF0175 family protein [Thermoanaerobaculia bacterium]|nr:UPF0175 family protein [Thermoanaerobaculia bacterium]